MSDKLAQVTVQQAIEAFPYPGGKGWSLTIRGNGHAEGASTYDSWHVKIAVLRVIDDIDQTGVLPGQGGNPGVGLTVVRSHKNYDSPLQVRRAKCCPGPA